MIVMVKKILSVVNFLYLIIFSNLFSVFNAVVTIAAITEFTTRRSVEGGRARGGCWRRSHNGSRLAVKYCAVCQLHHDVLGISGFLITLN